MSLILFSVLRKQNGKTAMKISHIAFSMWLRMKLLHMIKLYFKFSIILSNLRTPSMKISHMDSKQLIQ